MICRSSTVTVLGVMVELYAVSDESRWSHCLVASVPTCLYGHLKFDVEDSI